MAQTPEGKVKARVKKLLVDRRAYYFMPVQAGYGARGLDFHVCYRGNALFIETKAPNKYPTPLQAITINEIRKAGGIVYVIDGVNGELEKMEELMDLLDQQPIAPQSLHHQLRGVK